MRFLAIVPSVTNGLYQDVKSSEINTNLMILISRLAII